MAFEGDSHIFYHVSGGTCTKFVKSPRFRHIVNRVSNHEGYISAEIFHIRFSHLQDVQGARNEGAKKKNKKHSLAPVLRVPCLTFPTHHTSLPTNTVARSAFCGMEVNLWQEIFISPLYISLRSGRLSGICCARR